MAKRPTVLIVRDGWGHREENEHNAIAIARTPVADALMAEWPHTLIAASGEDVGLPAGVMGNSEVGHLNLGAGRVVWQEVTRIDRSIREGTFFENAALLTAFRHVEKTGGALHLMGLISDGLVHSAPNHYRALLEMAAKQGLPAERVHFHALTDGRDTPPKSAEKHLAFVLEHMQKYGTGRVATVSGRYYAMDRDKRWDRVERFHRCVTLGEGHRAADGPAAIRAAYDRGETDEFIEPTKITDASGEPIGLFASGDALIYLNFRADRTREFCHSLVDADFAGFARAATPAVHLVTMTHYEDTFDVPEAFPPQRLANIYADALASAGRTSFRTAETEKYAHVTFFFNGGIEKPWPHEERALVKSPPVATYDLQPEMSAPEVTKVAVKAIRSGKYDALVMNYANCDMVGHTGIETAAVAAVEAVDSGVGECVKAVLDMKGTVLVAADHGNAEEMWDEENGQPCTAHTTNPVPCILVGERYRGAKLREGGRLADVAPTLLMDLGLEVPPEMEGRSLVE